MVNKNNDCIKPGYYSFPEMIFKNKLHREHIFLKYSIEEN